MDKVYEVYDARTRKPMLDKEGEPRVFVCRDESPQNGDLVTVDDKEYEVQRVWDDKGNIVLRLQKMGIVLC